MPSTNKDHTKRDQSQPSQHHIVVETHPSHRALVGQGQDDGDGHVKTDTEMIDLNVKPHRVHDHTSFNEVSNVVFIFLSSSTNLYP